MAQSAQAENITGAPPDSKAVGKPETLPPHDELCLRLRDPMEAGLAGPASRGFCLCVLGNTFCSLLPWLSSGLCPWVPPSPTSGSVMGIPGTADRECPQGFPGFIKPWRAPRTTGEDLRSSPHLQSGPEASAFCAWRVAAARPHNLRSRQDHRHWDEPSSFSNWGSLWMSTVRSRVP